MKLSALAKATATLQPNHSILIYGPPKSGKTRLIGTAAKLPEIRRIYWFDLDNGIETLLGMKLSEAEMDKIIFFKLPDTKDNPIAIETILRAFSAKQPIHICDAHGKVNCVHCRSGKDFTGDVFRLADCGHHDLVVIDTGSQLGDSAVNAACLGKPEDFKPGWDEYGLAGKWLGDICAIIQQAHHTNFILATHEIGLEGDNNKDRMYPLVGTKNFSRKVAKYFGTVIYTHLKLGKHVAGSSSTYRNDVLTGSRLDAKIENAPELSMKAILIAGGILKEGITCTEPEQSATATDTATNKAASVLAKLRNA